VEPRAHGPQAGVQRRLGHREHPCIF
jgi:hypothetical protein